MAIAENPGNQDNPDNPYSPNYRYQPSWYETNPPKYRIPTLLPPVPPQEPGPEPPDLLPSLEHLTPIKQRLHDHLRRKFFERMWPTQGTGGSPILEDKPLWSPELSPLPYDPIPGPRPQYSSPTGIPSDKPPFPVFPGDPGFPGDTRGNPPRGQKWQNKWKDFRFKGV